MTPSPNFNSRVPSHKPHVSPLRPGIPRTYRDKPNTHPLKLSVYPEPKAMTVCIAAHAEHAGERKIVLCFDWLASDDFSTTEATFKCDLTFAHGLTAMFAGELRDAEELLRLYKKRFLLTTLTLENYEDELSAGMSQFKNILSGREYLARVAMYSCLCLASFKALQE